MADRGSPSGDPSVPPGCEQEPIHVPGLIQPHGALLVLEGPGLAVRRASANAGAVLGVPASDLLGRPLDGLLGPAQAAQLRMAAESADPVRHNPMKFTVPSRGGQIPLDALFHRSGEALVAEFETHTGEQVDFREYYRSVQRATVRLQAVGDVPALCEAAAEEVRRVTGFDRVMVYQFDRDWHGEIVAESHAEGLAATYLGLRFPASDIPAQARRLYETNLVRLIPDVGYAPVPLLGGDGPGSDPLDMSRSALRSVSPLHVEYLRNMGVAATLTISVLSGGRLWGLIACHHRVARMVSSDRRMTCEFLGHVFAAQLAIREDSEDRSYRLASTAVQRGLLERMGRASPTVWGLLGERPGLLDLIDAGGAAVVWGEECRTVGATPSAQEIQGLVDWLARGAGREFRATDALAANYPPASSFGAVAGGVLAVELSRCRRGYALWFRPELSQVVRWAGDPTKAVVHNGADGTGRLRPRKSFELWKQTVTGRCREWLPREQTAADDLRATVLGVIAGEEQLLARSRRQAAVAELGQRAVASIDLGILFREAVELTARTLDLQACRLIRGQPGGGTESLAAAGEPGHQVGDPLADFAITTEAAVVSEDLAHEPRFQAGGVRNDGGFASGLATPLVEGGRCFGALAGYSSRTRSFHAEEVHFLSVVANILVTTIRRSDAERALEHQSRHDSLTGLPNRTLLLDRLERAIAAASPRRDPLALMLIDMDRFKEINDTYGHHYGDDLLRQASGRLRDLIGPGGTVARLGGDEFAVLLPAADRAAAERSAASLLAALGQPFPMEGGELCEVGASLGIALYPEHGDESITLMRRADVAMYAAKRVGGGSSLYSAELDHHSHFRLALVGELRRAIEQGELGPAYQPKVDLRSRRFVGAEALMRWRHPIHGSIPPTQFIPIAEETGLIVPLDLLGLRQAFAQCRRWHALGLDLGVAVNLSPHNLHAGELHGIVADLLREPGPPPSRLTLEVTEGALMRDPEGAASTLRRLRDELGVRVSIDDFGSGYSSLAYLKRLPADEVKIDRLFIKDIATDRRDASIVQSVIELGHNLDLDVVAEGVEDAETLGLLAELGCDTAQGFYLGRPMPAEELTALTAAAAPPGGDSPTSHRPGSRTAGAVSGPRVSRGTAKDSVPRGPESAAVSGGSPNFAHRGIASPRVTG